MDFFSPLVVSGSELSPLYCDQAHAHQGFHLYHAYAPCVERIHSDSGPLLSMGTLGKDGVGKSSCTAMTCVYL